MRPDSQLELFLERGWIKFPRDAGLASWISTVLPHARETVKNPENAQWLRCDGTWFVGANTLPNDGTGSVGDSGPLTGPGCAFANQLGLGDYIWDRAQISVMYPGYPRRGEGESDAAHQFRLTHDSAHVDGLHAVGDSRRRYLYEHHGFVLGIPLVTFDSQASPLVVWEGSHHVVRNMFLEHLGNTAAQGWPKIDLTDPYHQTRRQAFSDCPRVEIYCRPGESYILHRHILHGVAPWSEGACSDPDGRMICYFRPELESKSLWLNAR